MEPGFFGVAALNDNQKGERSRNPSTTLRAGSNP